METLACIPPYIRDGLKRIVGLEAISVQEAKSAQQSVLIVHFAQQDKPTQVSSSLWQVLRAGGNCLVVRIWKGGSRWWNLTLAKNVQALATAELEGYRWAHKALGDKIPQILYACTTISKQGESPWAVFEYVGKQSKRFDGTEYIYDQYWTETMIKVRDEFGFAEPHPRWGRVPVDKSLQYAKRVLHQVTVPLHRYFFEHEGAIPPDHVGRLCGDLLVDESGHGCTFMWMVRRYRKAFLTMQASLFNTDASDKKLSEVVAVLEKCVENLESEHVRPLPCVLLHMDCQPQNLVFAKTLSKEDPWYISSVLDWEDSAYGDPRFELLLLGRKASLTRMLCVFVRIDVLF